MSFPRRPDTGTAGRAIPLRTNFFAVRTRSGAVVHPYSVAFDPPVPPAKARRIYQIWEAQARAQGLFRASSGGNGGSESDNATASSGPESLPVFDGRAALYAARPLPFDGPAALFLIDCPAYWDDADELLLQAAMQQQQEALSAAAGLPPGAVARRPPPATKRFQMTVTRLPAFDLQRLAAFLDGLVSDAPLDAIAFLDVLLRARPSLLFTTVGRCFYTPDAAAIIANGAQLWQGFHQSLRPARGQMLINLDVSATAFYQPGPLVEMIAKLLGRNNAAELRSPLLDKDRIKLERTLKNIKILVTHRGHLRRKYRIQRLTQTPANRTLFPLNDSGIEESVANYFLQKYGRQLYFAHLPCIVVGDPARPVYLPLEVCEVVPGQRHLRKLNERQTAEMIKFTCQPPHIRSNKISAGITLLQQQEVDGLADFGVSIDREMATVNARILPAPAISYHPSSKEPMVAQGVTLRSWCVVAFGAEQDYPVTTIQKFVTLLVQTCEECGIYVQNKQPPISYASPFGDIERTLIDAYMVAGDSYQERPQLIVCILPNTGVPLYAEIKRVSDTVIGIATQCIQAKHMFAAKRQYCANVCLKINVKLGGMNSYLSSVQLPFISERPTIVMGADVTHPAMGSLSTQSIAAVVASMDAQCSRYAASIRVQRGRHEHIQDLGGMAIELLKTFFQTCGAKPERIIFYRDGVSEGQFFEVLRREVEALRAACTELEEGYRPTITYVVVQKRHHARFFPIRKEDSDRSGNVLPGTVVETGITHPFEFDFYLCSHPGLQGTSKPTFYHVLFDENRFTSDSLQELTYRLCYLYCRATRSVSVVPPAYYAHLVAARARFHASGEEIAPSDSASVVSGGSGGNGNGGNSGNPYANQIVSVTMSANAPMVGGLIGSTQNQNAQIPAQQHMLSKRFSTASMRTASGLLDGAVRTLIYSPVKPELTRVMYFM
ncbi:Piwi domain-containing protein [Entophlyctis helioformis]|nr:Piwi domain-containing protein [Entophlyctis helioformis]